MGKKLSRVRARVSIILLVVGIACLTVGIMRQGGRPLLVAGVVIALASMPVRPWGCFECGRKVTPKPQWSGKGKYHCPYCGARFVYDDEQETE